MCKKENTAESLVFLFGLLLCGEDERIFVFSTSNNYVRKMDFQK